MKEFTFTFWTNTGPRDGTNCASGWGKRTMKVKGRDHSDALANLIGMVGRDSYGGLAS